METKTGSIGSQLRADFARKSSLSSVKVVSFKHQSYRPEDRMITLPDPVPSVVSKWTHYGRWTPEGLQVLNNRSRVVYDLG